MRILSIFVFILFSSFSYAQQSPWHIQITGGVSVPVGSFSDNDTQEASIFGEDNLSGYKYFIGVSKKTNGFAKTGSFMGIALDYYTRPQFSISLEAGYMSNPVDEKLLSEILTEFVGLPTRFEEDNYTNTFLLLGPQYRFLHDHPFSTTVSTKLGPSWLEFPHYKYLLLYTASSYIGQDIQEDDLVSLMVKLGVSVDYTLKHFNFILGVDYLSSTYDFTIKNRLIPGGSGTSAYDDKIRYRQLNVKAGIGYRF